MLDLRGGAARRQLDYGIMEADLMIDLTSLETQNPRLLFEVRPGGSHTHDNNFSKETDLFLICR
jgi:hypothetical protein